MTVLYLKPVSGLANRLRTIASARVEARRTGRRMQVLWERDHALNCNFRDLFQPPEDFAVTDYCRGVPEPLLPAVRALWPTSRRQADSAPHRWLRRRLAPGLAKEDFNIKVEKDTLSISAKKETAPVEGENVKVREFAYTSFARNFTLPKTVNAEAIEARYENGILFLSIPKKEEALPQVRQIEVG
jgi:hypothetical protein